MKNNDLRIADVGSGDRSDLPGTLLPRLLEVNVATWEGEEDGEQVAFTGNP